MVVKLHVYGGACSYWSCHVIAARSVLGCEPEVGLGGCTAVHDIMVLMMLLACNGLH